jgi:hypothetical protein
MEEKTRNANMLSYTMRAGFQHFWWSALAKFVTGDENASSKIPHGAYSFPLAVMRSANIEMIRFEYINY